MRFTHSEKLVDGRWVLHDTFVNLDSRGKTRTIVEVLNEQNEDTVVED